MVFVELWHIYLSRSLRARGLKPYASCLRPRERWSRSLRARGLKRDLLDGSSSLAEVALPASAWIETLVRDVEGVISTVALPASAWIETRSFGE